MSKQEDICGLLASRICHDLISPIGAISNGIELLELEPQLGRSAEIALVRESVENAAARIRFIRVAFGMAGESQYLARSEVQGLLADWLAHGRLAADWQVEGDHPRLEIRRVFLALMCLESALPLGGLLRVTRGPASWVLNARAARTRIEPGLWRLLTEKAPYPPEELSPARVQFLLLLSDLGASAAEVRLIEHEGGLDLEIPRRSA